MPKPIHLYVSSSPELYAEREAVGQVVAALPLTIGWRIGHTPLPGESGGEDVAHVEGAHPRDEEAPLKSEECDLYALILGHDFAAPMGFELRQALVRGKRPLAAYGKECTHSPSAQDAARRADLAWQTFSTPEEFRAAFRRDLLQAVLERADQLGLEMDEVQRLLELSREAKREGAAGEGADRRRADAGRSGRILGREVWEGGTQGR